MNKLVTKFAALAVLAAASAASPALAAGGRIDCSLPAFAGNPFCPPAHPGTGPAPAGPPAPQHNAGTQFHPAPPVQNGPPPGFGQRPWHGHHMGPGWDNNWPGDDAFQYGDVGPGRWPGSDHGTGWDRGPGSDNFPWNAPDRSQFRSRFRHYHFSPFPRPDFPIRLGFAVPGYYDLRPLPPAIFAYYPYYRGYLFFETMRGDIVIVDPDTYRIVAIL